MRPKVNLQAPLDFHPSNLKITNDYFATYEVLSQVLDQNPRIVSLVHQDLEKLLPKAKATEWGKKPGRPYVYSSDTVLRILICQRLEGECLRGIVIRIDDSHSLRRFVRIDDGDMMDFTTLCKLKNAIRPATWEKINDVLTDWVIRQDLISGDRLRLDTTAFETNIHWPTDSSLLWDLYRVVARWVRRIREVDPELVGTRRLQDRAVRRLASWFARKAGRKSSQAEAVKERYRRLFGHVEDLFHWVEEIADGLQEGLKRGLYPEESRWVVKAFLESLPYYQEIAERVVSQAQRRVFEDEKVPATEKVYSIFESHTEILMRGKAGKAVEFGHMVLLEQVEGKYITGYEVFSRKPNETQLVEAILDRHRKRFGCDPRELCADRGFYESMDRVKALEKRIKVVAIAKKGKRNNDEAARERSVAFKLGQMFRAGIEGTISFLKRALGMSRCMNKGWANYTATVGSIIFVHNLLIISRGFG
jgi:IS5 family transposase